MEKKRPSNVKKSGTDASGQTKKSPKVDPVSEKKPKPSAPSATKKEVVRKKDGIKVPADHFYGTGKRKTAIAKVWLFKGTGKVIVNGLDALDYVKSSILVSEFKKPLKKLNLQDQYDCKVSCLGGGIVGQVGAVKLGIARALLDVDPEFRKQLKVEGFLTRDSRIKERKKYGRKRARKGFQFRKR